MNGWMNCNLINYETFRHAEAVMSLDTELGVCTVIKGLLAYLEARTSKGPGHKHSFPSVLFGQTTIIQASVECTDRQVPSLRPKHRGYNVVLTLKLSQQPG